MPDVYAATLELTPRGADPFAAFHEALREWVGDRWPVGVPWFLLDDPDSLRSPTGSIFRWEPFRAEDRALFEFSWRHAHVGDPSITWSTRCALSQVRGKLQLSLVVANTGPERPLAAHLPTTRPRLLLSLLERFGVRCDGYLVRLAPRGIPAGGLTDFARYYLPDKDRTHPIILLTPRADGGFEVPPETIVREFMTLAETFYAETPHSTFELTRELGKRFSVFLGALRVYMPGFHKEDNPFRHPLILARRLSEGDERLRLAQFLAAFTVRRFRENVVLAQLRDERAVRAEERRKALFQSLEAAEIAAARDANDWRQLADEADKENKALRARVDNLEEQLEAAHNTITALQSNFREFQLAQGLEPAQQVEPEFLPSSVLEAVEMAELTYGDQLLFLPTVGGSAVDSPYERPREVFEALAFLADVARRMGEGPLGRSLKDEFREHGFDYGSGLSPTTPKRIRQQYRFTDGARVHVCEQHLGLGSSAYDPKECLRIYFNAEERVDDRMVVGHVGRHLDVLSTS